jgi:hypothetical protein
MTSFEVKKGQQQRGACWEKSACLPYSIAGNPTDRLDFVAVYRSFYVLFA